MREIYRYHPEIQQQLELRKRVGRVEKFAPIYNKLLRSGIVIDLGCGTGVYMKKIHSRTVVGIDFSLEAILLAKEYCPSRLFVLGDLEYLPFRENSIDSFFSFCSIYCLLPGLQYKLFKDIYKMLKEGGNVVLVEPNAWNPIKEGGIKHPLNRNKVERQLKEIGFKNVAIKFSNFVPRPITGKGNKYVFDIFHVLEKFFEFLQVPLSGSLTIYAEKRIS